MRAAAAAFKLGRGHQTPRSPHDSHWAGAAGSPMSRARVDGLSCVICRAHAEKLAPSRSGDRKILAIAAHGHGIVIACATKQFTVLNRATYIGAAVVRVLGVFVPIGGGL